VPPTLEEKMPRAQGVARRARQIKHETKKEHVNNKIKHKLAL